MKDPEIELLNDLAKKYPADADDFVRPLPVSEGYAGDLGFYRERLRDVLGYNG